MYQTISLTVVSDHKFFGECLVVALRDCEHFKVQDLIQSEAEALERVQHDPPDVILIDWQLQESRALDCSRYFSQSYPALKVLIFGLSETEADIRACVEAGASGYMLKDASLQELLHAIELLGRGETMCSAYMAQALFSRLSELARTPKQRELTDSMPLTARELETLYFVAAGWSNNQIADHLCLSIYTVKNHVHNILKKLQVQSRLEAAEYANRRRWLPPRHA